MQKERQPADKTRLTAAAGVRGRPRVFDRDRALAEATLLFWRKGYEATSIADLTQAMGVGTTSLYAAFGSKDALYAEALQHYVDTYGDLALGRFRAAATAREAASAYLLDSAAVLTGSVPDLPRGCMATLATVSSEGHEALADVVRLNRLGGFHMLRDRFARGVDQGDLPPTTDVSGLATFIQTVQSGMSILARDGANRAALERAAEIALCGWDRFVDGA